MLDTVKHTVYYLEPPALASGRVQFGAMKKKEEEKAR